MSLLQAGDAGHLHARPELELVAGDGRADGHADEPGLDAVLGQRVLEHAGRVSSTSAPVDLLAPGPARAAWPGGSFHGAGLVPRRPADRHRSARSRRRPGASSARPVRALGAGARSTSSVARRRRRRRSRLGIVRRRLRGPPADPRRTPGVLGVGRRWRFGITDAASVRRRRRRRRWRWAAGTARPRAAHEQPTRQARPRRAARPHRRRATCVRVSDADRPATSTAPHEDRGRRTSRRPQPTMAPPGQPSAPPARASVGDAGRGAGVEPEQVEQAESATPRASRQADARPAPARRPAPGARQQQQRADTTNTRRGHAARPVRTRCRGRCRPRGRTRPARPQRRCRGRRRTPSTRTGQPAQIGPVALDEPGAPSPPSVEPSCPAGGPRRGPVPSLPGPAALGCCFGALGAARRPGGRLGVVGSSQRPQRVTAAPPAPASSAGGRGQQIPTVERATGTAGTRRQTSMHHRHDHRRAACAR